MTAMNAQKLKVLHLMEIMRTQTDPKHGLTMPQIIEKLAERGITAERKSMYRDIEALREFGFDIRTLQRQPVQYVLAERDFELPQLMLLIDAVQSSKFLSDGSSRALVKSIRSMASLPERSALDKQVHVYGRPKRQNQSDFVVVDKLQDAMAAKKKVSFKYFRYNAEKKKEYRKDGSRHTVTPVNLTYSDGSYYLVAFSDADGEIRNYRVDRMEQVEKLDEPRERNEVIASYDADEVAECVFGMYEGERVMATLKVASEVMNVVIDRFGRDVEAKPVNKGAFAKLRVPVKASPVFYGWLATLGADVKIESPKKLRESYLEWLQQIVGSYAT